MLNVRFYIKLLPFATKKVRKITLISQADPLIVLLPLWPLSAIMDTGEDEAQ
jgi:hypothetical protein